MTLLLLGSTVPAAAAADSQAGEDARTMSAVQTFQASGTTITYEVDPGDEVYFDLSDFQDVFDEEYDGDDLCYVTFDPDSDYNSIDGSIYCDYGSRGEEAFPYTDDFDRCEFYSTDSDYDGDYALDDLSFVDGDDFDETISIDFRAYDDDDNYVDGTLVIESTETHSSSSSRGEIVYEVDAGDEVTFDRSDFNELFQEEYDDYTLRYVVFEPDSDYSSADGSIYYDYGFSDEISFSRSKLGNYEFYYSDSDYGDYALRDLSFVAGDDFDEELSIDFRAYYSNSRYVDGTLVIKPSGSSSSKGDITYEVDPGDEIYFDSDDFDALFSRTYLKYVEFSISSRDYNNVDGYLCIDSDRVSDIDDINDSTFYYDDDRDGDYALDDLSFEAFDDFSGSFEIDFRAYDEDDDYVDGTLVIKSSGSSSSKADITYQVDPDDSVAFDRSDFNDFFQEEYDDYTLRYVVFEADSDYTSADGAVYYDYDGRNETSFSRSRLSNYEFYYSDSDYGDYALDDLSFVAGRNFDEAVTLSFRAYYSNSRYVDGTVRIEPTGSSTSTSSLKANILYTTTTGNAVQINANDIARFYSAAYPGYQLQYVKLDGVPSLGSLYYNYYSASKYGTTQLRLTASNCGSQLLYFSPTSTSQYSLSELTYIPGGSNYCVTVPFTAYGSGSTSVKGSILISVTPTLISEVYGVTPKGNSVNFPSSSIYASVVVSTGSALSSIQLLSLPSATVGTVYVSSGTLTRADTSTLYTYTGNSNSISQLRFVPATGYTGSVEIPYVAYSSNGTAIGAGKFCLGVVSSIRQFTDMTSSTWCYKYVTELSDAKVIDGYTDGTFRPNNTVTYGQALKLIMLAAGYSAQAQTGSHPFSGYLSRAQKDGLVSGSINLDAPITRLAVAQIAAKAMKLSTSGLSSVKPFTDTSDPYVQALNAAGIVEGYFSNGTSTYKPYNTLTRGQISAIVWRMERAL